MGLPSGSVGQESACNAGIAGDTGLIPGSGRSPGGRNGNVLQDSCWEIPVGQRILTAYSPWDHKESDVIELTCIYDRIIYNNDFAQYCFQRK